MYFMYCSQCAQHLQGKFADSTAHVKTDALMELQSLRQEKLSLTKFKGHTELLK